jgi:hypothetical protein
VSVLCAVLVVAGLGGAWAISDGPEDRAALADALDVLPASTLTVDFTDWTGIDVSPAEAALSGLTTRSAVASLEDEMSALLGWSPADLAWEAHGRTGTGAVTALGLGDVSPERAARSFAAIGTADDGTYRLDETAASADFASTFAWVRVVADRGVLLAATDEDTLAAAFDVVQVRSPSLLSVRGVGALAERLVGSDSVLLQERRVLCPAASVPVDDVTAARQLAAALGPVRLAEARWGARALLDGTPQRIVFASAFDSAAVARRQGPLRAGLASGPFIGRTGAVGDSLRDLRTSVDGAVVSLDFSLTPDGEQFMTDTGPVVFAGCAAPGTS